MVMMLTLQMVVLVLMADGSGDDSNDDNDDDSDDGSGDGSGDDSGDCCVGGSTGGSADSAICANCVSFGTHTHIESC